VIKGDKTSITILEEEYEAGLDTCKHNLHGRIFWPKGSTAFTVVALRKKLALAWKDLGRWGVSFIGKGYYEFCFSSVEDLRRVRSVGTWNLEPGLLKLFAWLGDFNPSLQRNCTAQVWLRIYGLSQEYWRPKILFAVASSVGSPICTDEAATKSRFDRTFGQFARVLVDMDLSQPLKYNVLVERKGYAFFVDFDYENIPDFCNHCKAVGHHVRVCKKLKNVDAIENNKQGARNTASKQNDALYLIPKTNQTYVQTKDGRNSQAKPKEVIDLEGTSDNNRNVSQNKDKEKLPDQQESNSKSNPGQTLKEQDKILEEELNVEIQNNFVSRNDEEESSVGSDFVDATQNNLDTTSVEGEEVADRPLNNNEQITTVAVVANKDMSAERT